MENITFEDVDLLEKRVNPYNKSTRFPNDGTTDANADDMTGWVRDDLIGEKTQTKVGGYRPDRDIYPDTTSYFNDWQRTSTVDLNFFDLTTQEGFKQHVYYEENGWIFKLPFKGITFTNYNLSGNKIFQYNSQTGISDGYWAYDSTNNKLDYVEPTDPTDLSSGFATNSSVSSISNVSSEPIPTSNGYQTPQRLFKFPYIDKANITSKITYDLKNNKYTLPCRILVDYSAKSSNTPGKTSSSKLQRSFYLIDSKQLSSTQINSNVGTSLVNEDINEKEVIDVNYIYDVANKSFSIEWINGFAKEINRKLNFQDWDNVTQKNKNDYNYVYQKFSLTNPINHSGWENGTVVIDWETLTETELNDYFGNFFSKFEDVRVLNLDESLNTKENFTKLVDNNLNINSMDGKKFFVFGSELTNNMLVVKSKDENNKDSFKLIVLGVDKHWGEEYDKKGSLDNDSNVDPSDQNFQLRSLEIDKYSITGSTNYLLQQRFTIKKFNDNHSPALSFIGADMIKESIGSNKEEIYVLFNESIITFRYEERSNNDAWINLLEDRSNGDFANQGKYNTESGGSYPNQNKQFHYLNLIESGTANGFNDNEVINWYPEADSNNFKVSLFTQIVQADKSDPSSISWLQHGEHDYLINKEDRKWKDSILNLTKFDEAKYRDKYCFPKYGDKDWNVEKDFNSELETNETNQGNAWRSEVLFNNKLHKNIVFAHMKSPSSVLQSTAFRIHQVYGLSKPERKTGANNKEHRPIFSFYAVNRDYLVQNSLFTPFGSELFKKSGYNNKSNNYRKEFDLENDNVYTEISYGTDNFVDSNRTHQLVINFEGDPYLKSIDKILPTGLHEEYHKELNTLTHEWDQTAIQGNPQTIKSEIVKKIGGDDWHEIEDFNKNQLSNLHHKFRWGGKSSLFGEPPGWINDVLMNFTPIANKKIFYTPFKSEYFEHSLDKRKNWTKGDGIIRLTGLNEGDQSRNENTKDNRFGHAIQVRNTPVTNNDSVNYVSQKSFINNFPNYLTLKRCEYLNYNILNTLLPKTSKGLFSNIPTCVGNFGEYITTTKPLTLKRTLMEAKTIGVDPDQYQDNHGSILFIKDQPEMTSQINWNGIVKSSRKGYIHSIND